MYIFCCHQKLVYQIIKIFMICGLEINIEMDFIELGCCSVNWTKVAEDNIHWWCFVNIRIIQVYNNVVLLECCHP